MFTRKSYLELWLKWILTSVFLFCDNSRSQCWFLFLYSAKVVVVELTKPFLIHFGWSSRINLALHHRVVEFSVLVKWVLGVRGQKLDVWTGSWCSQSCIWSSLTRFCLRGLEAEQDKRKNGANDQWTLRLSWSDACSHTSPSFLMLIWWYFCKGCNNTLITYWLNANNLQESLDCLGFFNFLMWIYLDGMYKVPIVSVSFQFIVIILDNNANTVTRNDILDLRAKKKVPNKLRK